MMDLDDFRWILNTTGVDVWTFIDTAILVASLDHRAELKQRRVEIMERLYATSVSTPCDFDGGNGRTNGVGVAMVEEQSHHHQELKEQVSPQMVNGAHDDPYGGLFDDHNKRIFEIGDCLQDPVQSEDSIIELLQSLSDMAITFKVLQETDIGRHVNGLRKHPSNHVKKSVKRLVRKWKGVVDEWVKMNELASSAAHMVNGDSPQQKNGPDFAYSPNRSSGSEPERKPIPPRREAPIRPAALMVNGDSPQQKIIRNGPDFVYSPNPQNGSSGSDKFTSEPEKKPIPPQSSPAPERPREHQQKERNFDAERLASARKRLRENYKEANDAKKKRRIQVIDIHEIPRTKPLRSRRGQ